MRAYLALPFQLWMLRNASRLRPVDVMSALFAPLTASTIMGAIVWTLMHFIQPLFSEVVVPLIICVATGVAVYPLLLLAVSPQARGLARHYRKALYARFLKR